MMPYMEKVEITVLNNVKDDAIKNYQLFKWRLIEERNNLKETTLVFERDNEVSYYQDLVKLEDKFNKVYTIPGWLFYVLVGITLIYVTLIAILWLTHSLPMEKSQMILLLAIPTGVLLLINVFLSYLRNKEMDYHINNKEEKYRKYQQKIDEISK